MRALQDNDLVNCYLESLKLHLDEAFIALLLAEISKRKIKVPQLVSR